MRKEYSLKEKSWLESIKDFLSQIPIYTLESDIKEFRHDPFFKYNLKYKLMTFNNTIHNNYLHFIDWGNDYYSMLVSTEYDASQEVFYQKGLIVNGNLKTEEMYEARDYRSKLKIFAHHIPCISMYKPARLIANYHYTNDTIMLSGVYEGREEYETYTDTFTRTVS